MRTYPLFKLAIEQIKRDLETVSYEVKNNRWQSIDVRDKPEMRTREVFNTSFMINLANHGEKLKSYQKDIEPNLPWADDHFLERISGQPLNPGEEWRNWPYAHSADKFHDYPAGPLLSTGDWAYLAGLIDGDGSISIWSPKPSILKRGRISISQVDKNFLESVIKKFRVGSMMKVTQPTILNGKLHKGQKWRWSITANIEVLWILRNVLPHLGLKRQKAEEALIITEANPPSSRGRPRKTLWQEEWESRFSHTYMQRLWPEFDNGKRPQGMMFQYGNLEDVAQHLYKYPESRQAYVPIWYPEDTGCTHEGRLPCTLGYHFLLRHGYLHTTYYIRSCDFVRHFRDDLYLSVRLLLWMLDELRSIETIATPNKLFWNRIKPGMFVFHCVSMHCFQNDFATLDEKEQ